jgi:hypothetical protein
VGARFSVPVQTGSGAHSAFNGASVEWNWQGKIEALGEKPVPVPLFPPQITHGPTRNRTRASALRGRRLTARAMARPLDLALGCIYDLWAVSWNYENTERQRIFLSFYELHCFIRSAFNPEIAACSSLFTIHVTTLKLCWCESFISMALRRLLHSVFWCGPECLTALHNNVRTRWGLRQRAAPCSYLAARLSNLVIPNIEIKYVIFLLRTRETRVHTSSQTSAIFTQDSVVSLNPSRQLPE